jgi:hypothetical protein
MLILRKRGEERFLEEKGLNYNDGEKAWSTMNHSILPAAHLGDITSFPNVLTII